MAGQAVQLPPQVLVVNKLKWLEYGLDDLGLIPTRSRGSFMPQCPIFISVTCYDLLGLEWLECEAEHLHLRARLRLEICIGTI
jgi:hypothetical protein